MTEEPTHKVHPDWNYSWDVNNIQDYAIKALNLSSPNATTHSGSSIRRYEFIIREYLSEIKSGGLAGAVNRVVEKYAFLGVTPALVNNASKVWRESNKVPIKYSKNSSTLADLEARVTALEETVEKLSSTTYKYREI